MFAKNECNFIILDTCTLLHHGHLIVRILISIWKNKLNFQLVIPKIVIIELKAQQYNRVGLDSLDTYLSWDRHARYKCYSTTVAEQATFMIYFIEKCLSMRIPNLHYQGNHETKDYPVVVADDLLLDCLLYFYQKSNGNATLISHDLELCCKAQVFKMNTIRRGDHKEWRELLHACKVDFKFALLPTKSEKRKEVLSEERKKELMYRPMIDCDIEVKGMYQM